MKTLAFTLSLLLFSKVITAQTNVHYNSPLKWLEVNKTTTQCNSSPEKNHHLIPDNGQILIESLPPLNARSMTPFNLKLNQKGIYHFTLSAALSIPTNRCAYIEDLYTSELFDLKTARTYSFFVNDTTPSIRFLLHIIQPIHLSALPTTCSKSANGKIILKSNLTANWTFVWKNAQGGIVKVNNTSKLCDTIKNLSAGMYYLNAISNTNYCASITDSIEVKSNMTLMVQSTLFKNLINSENNFVLKSTKLSGARSAYLLNWSESDSALVLSNSNQSAYKQMLLDSKNCREINNHEVVKPNIALVKNFPTIFPDMYLLISLNPLNKIMVPESSYQLLLKAETSTNIHKKTESNHNHLFAFHLKGQKEKHKASLLTPVVLSAN